jgi:hypothetical protein
MIRSEATIAIVRSRLQRELPILSIASAACALLAYLQRYDNADARTAGCIVFATLAGVACALLMRGFGRHRELDLCEQSAPLFGRELARATALVPCIIATAAVAAFWLVTAFYAPPAASGVAVSALCAYAATLTAMCATVRTGWTRLFYVALAGCLSASGFMLMQTSTLLALLFCALAGFIALRQYGEALARYDPV